LIACGNYWRFDDPIGSNRVINHDPLVASADADPDQRAVVSNFV
jgi:hypothetical protein